MMDEKTDKRIGNQFWKLRSKHGRDKIFKTPQLMWEAACEYFQWVEDNPLKEQKVFHSQGVITTYDSPVIRAMTLKGLCFYLNANDAYFKTFKSRLTEEDKGFDTVIKDIENIIYSQKFAGAAANMLNANIIARDLGLSEHTEATVTTNIFDMEEVEKSLINLKDAARRIDEAE